MISRLIELEQNRLKAMGYDSVVTPIAVPITTALVNINLANDTYILSGIRMSDVDVASSRHKVCISSATDGVMGMQRELGMMGRALHKLMKNFIIVKTTDNEAWSADKSIPSFTLDFVKITPIKNQ